MLFISGSAAHSSFRLAKLLKDLQSVNSNIQSVRSQFVHIAHIDNIDNESSQLSSEETKVLEALLAYGEKTYLNDFEPNLWTFPRFGTISPWSSKATDIVHNAYLRFYMIV